MQTTMMLAAAQHFTTTTAITLPHYTVMATCSVSNGRQKVPHSTLLQNAMVSYLFRSKSSKRMLKIYFFVQLYKYQSVQRKGSVS